MCVGLERDHEIACALYVSYVVRISISRTTTPPFPVRSANTVQHVPLDSRKKRLCETAAFIGVCIKGHLLPESTSPWNPYYSEFWVIHGINNCTISLS